MNLQFAQHKITAIKLVSIMRFNFKATPANDTD